MLMTTKTEIDGGDAHLQYIFELYFYITCIFCLSIRAYLSIQAYDAAIWCPASGVREGE